MHKLKFITHRVKQFNEIRCVRPPDHTLLGLRSFAPGGSFVDLMLINCVVPFVPDSDQRDD